MRHSDIRLTMETYTDPKLLDVAGALDSLPALNTARESRSRKEKKCEDGQSEADAWLVPTVVQRRHSESSGVIMTAESKTPRVRLYANTGSLCCEPFVSTTYVGMSEWDRTALRFTTNQRANEFVRSEYRIGWENDGL